MPRYKRTRDEAELDLSVATEPEMPAEQQETLDTLRSMWEFASLMQYIYLFGQVVKIDDDFDIEDLESECLKPTPSDKLAHMGLQLLKYVSSHRGLTPEIFDEYTRRQYLAKAPQRNPFGDEEEPVKFNDLDVFTRIKILQQLSTWTLGNAERIRGMMPQDEDHLNWRMEPLGWDKEDRSYYVLDDNRLYRRSDEPPPAPLPKPKAKAKAKPKAAKGSRSRGTRASKRRRIEDTEDEEPEEHAEDADETMADGEVIANGGNDYAEEEPGFGFTSKTWECVAITLDEYQDFMASIFRSRDPNEKQLRSRIEDDVLPIIEKRAEALRQKQLKKVRELENLQKMATAKRSSRLAGKAEKEKQEREEREADEKKQRELRMAHEEQERQKRVEEGHESRRLTREQRVKDREVKRILHEEELAKLEQEAERAASHDADDADVKRASERQRKTQKEQHKKELEKLAEDDGNWYFDCAVCGKHGENMDDGTHSIACDRCEVWMHSKCHGFSPKQAESDDFTFVCGTCKRKEEDAKKPKLPPLKLHNRTSGSPETQKASSRPTTANGQLTNGMPGHVGRQLDDRASHHSRPSPGPFGQLTNGPSLSPHGQAHGPPGYRYPPISNFAPHAPQQPWQGSPLPPPGRPSSSYGTPQMANGHSPAHHQQQHQYAHHSAVASSGAHPGYYQQPYAPPPNGHNPRAPAGMFHQPPPQQHYPPPPPHYNHYARPPSGQLMNGFQSPAKPPAKPMSASPPPPQRAISQGHSQGTPPGHQPQQHVQQHLQQSPRTNLPPPNSHQQGPVQSPIKSSPQPHYPPPPSDHQQFSPPPAAQTPHSHHPTANGHQNRQSGHHANQLQTPQQMMGQDGTTNAANANKVAADGMSGPWPQGSSAIPQKHQSPVAPAPVHSLGEKKIFPPETPLVPSPHQQAGAATASIPVKRLPEEVAQDTKPDLNGLPPRPPSHPEMDTQAKQAPITLPPIQAPPQQ